MTRSGISPRHITSFACVLGTALFAASACATPVKVDPIVVSVTSARLNALSEQIGGTLAQRRAGELVQYHLYQDAIVGCLAQKGYSYTPPPFVDIYTGLNHLDAGDGTWFAKLDDRGLGIAAQAVRLAPLDRETPNPGFDKLGAADRARYDTALNGCIPTDTPDVYIPGSSAQVNARFLRMLSDVEKSARVTGVAKGYASCMRAAGFDVTGHEELIELVQREVGTVPSNAVGNATRPEWQVALDRDRAAGAADAGCRKTVHDIAMMLITVRLDDFEKQSAADLAKVQQDWAALVARATVYPEAALLGLR